MAGGGIYGDNGPIRPTQRFWNLKQLGCLKAGAFWLPVKANRTDVSCAGLGNIASGEYAVHLVNNGATRPVILSGLPPETRKLALYITDATRGMQLMAIKGVVDGTVIFQLEGQAFTTLKSAY